DIIDIAKNSERHHGMGTTIVAAHIVPELSALHLAYVGDSRCYRLRDGRMELLTHDHTLIHDVLELKPDLSEEKALDLPRHVITRALGMGAQLRVSVRSHSLLPGDVYLLCSDGLTDEVEESEIVEALLLAKSSEERVHLLIDLALEHQAEDNIAAVVIHCELTRGAGTLPKTPRTRERPIPVSPLSRPPKKRAGTSEPSPNSSSGSSASRVEEDHSYPEIIVVQEDVEPEDRNTNVFVVPQSSALKPGAIDAAKQVVAPVGVGPLSFRCTSCGVLLKHDVKICGICGTPVRPSTRPQ
ncbi:MAG: SpoIIE family protein phosphatase, partial [Myxococcota bacterium]